MIISTNITRNKKPAQAAYQMVDPEPAVQNEPKVDSEVVLGDDEDNTQEPAPATLVEDKEPAPAQSTEEIKQTNTSEEEEGKTETTPDQEQPSVPEPEQSQEEHVEETPKKKASSKKK